MRTRGDIIIYAVSVLGTLCLSLSLLSAANTKGRLYESRWLPRQNINETCS